MKTLQPRSSLDSYHGRSSVSGAIPMSHRLCVEVEFDALVKRMSNKRTEAREVSAMIFKDYTEFVDEIIADLDHVAAKDLMLSSTSWPDGRNGNQPDALGNTETVETDVSDDDLGSDGAFGLLGRPFRTFYG